MTRIKISHDGTIRLPAKMLRSIGLRPGSYAIVEKDEDEGRLWIEKTDYDPFAEGAEASAEDSIERIIEKEREKSDRATEKFEQLMEDPPEMRPEDRRDLWD